MMNEILADWKTEKELLLDKVALVPCQIGNVPYLGSNAELYLNQWRKHHCPPQSCISSPTHQQYSD